MPPISEQMRQTLSSLTVAPVAPALLPAPAAVGDKCPTCANTGLLGWKSPRHYPLAECEFCPCDAGQTYQALLAGQQAQQRQARLTAAFTSAGIPPHFQDFTLDTLAALIANEPDKRTGIEAARAIAATGAYNGKTSLCLVGPVGSGKTGLVTPILRQYLDAGLSALWIEFYDFCEAVQSKYGQGDESAQAMDLVRSVDWLLIDDVGDPARPGPETDDKRRLLYQIVNHRHNHRRPMLITSNLDLRGLAAQFGERTVERIYESCAVIRVGGRNLRRDPS